MCLSTRLLAASTVLLLAACGPKSGGEDSPSWLDLGPGAPQLCLPKVPAAGGLRKEAETWELAAAALKASDPATAHEILIVETEHPSLDALRGIVHILGQDGAGAWDKLRPLADAWASDPCLDQVAALAAMQAGEVESALALIERAVAGDLDDAEIGLTRVLFLLQQGRRDDALAGLDALLTLHPEHVGLAFSRAVVHLEENDIESAIPLFEVAQRGGMDMGEDLTRMYFLVDRRADYLRAASELYWPLGDDQAIAEAEDPEAAYDAHLGLTEGAELHAVFVTPLGEVDCTLFPEDAPVTVANFVGLARGTHPWVDPATGEKQEGRPYYDGTVFHRVIPGFMVQGGDPTGEGSGGPGYRFADEISGKHGFKEPGMLAMANSGPDSNGSQFFITDGDASWLEGSHTIFGTCDEAGQAVVSELGEVERGRMDKPLEDLVLETVRIEVR